MENRINKTARLLLVAETIADSTISMTDDEILGEIEKEGFSVTSVSNAFNSMLDSVKLTIKKESLAHSREEIRKDRQDQVTSLEITADQARKIIEYAIREMPELTMAAQSEDASNDELSEQDLLVIVEALRDLGLDLNKALNE